MCYIRILNTKRLGSWIAERRNEKVWTQEELADKLDVSQNTVSRWEKGEMMPSRANLQKIAKLFGVTVQEIFMEIAKPEDIKADLQSQSGMEIETERKPGSKSLQDRIHELEAENGFLKAENKTLHERIQKLKAMMRQAID